MVPLLFLVMHWLVWILPYILMAGWIVGMADPEGRWAITRALNAISAPYLRQVSGMLPRIGALDLSPMLIVILAIIVDRLLGALSVG